MQLQTSDGQNFLFGQGIDAKLTESVNSIRLG